MKDIVLYRIGSLLNINGFKYTEPVKYIGYETNSMYVVSRVDGESNRRVKKVQILVPTSVTIDSHKYISYQIWYKDGDIDNAKEILKKHIMGIAKKIKDEANMMFVHIEE